MKERVAIITNNNKVWCPLVRLVSEHHCVIIDQINITKPHNYDVIKGRLVWDYNNVYYILNSN